MKKTSYISPEITVVDFKTERGFQATGGEHAAPTSFLDKLGLTMSRETYYSTGEDYSEYTSTDGSFSTGGWL